MLWGAALIILKYLAIGIASLLAAGCLLIPPILISIRRYQNEDRETLRKRTALEASEQYDDGAYHLVTP